MMRSWLIAVVILAAFVPLASAEYSFNLITQGRVHNAEPGEIVPILMDVTNTGETDAYRAEAIAIGVELGDWDDPDPNLWKAQADPEIFELAVNESITITINVSVPANARQGDSAVIGALVFNTDGGGSVQNIVTAQEVATITVVTLNLPSLGLLATIATTIVSGKVFYRRG